MSNETRRHQGLGDIDPSAPLGSSHNPSHAIVTIPNLITLFRLLFTVLFLVLYPTDRYHVLAIVLFIVAACTDWIDGKLARKLQQVSWFGKRFDPVMDRVLIVSGLIALTVTDRIPLWIALFLVLRDAYLAAGGSILVRRAGRIPDVCYVGKACTFTLMAGFAALLLDLLPLSGLGWTENAAFPGFAATSVSFGIWLVYCGCVLSFIAASIYTVRGVTILRSSAHDDHTEVHA